MAGGLDRVRLAIVGCGNISQLNAPGYLQHPLCDVVALCDADPERAKRRAREWGIAPRLYSDFAQVLDDDAVDAVELLTPTWMHAEQIVAALAAGKHVSAQKPLAVSIVTIFRSSVKPSSLLPVQPRPHIQGRLVPPTTVVAPVATFTFTSTSLPPPALSVASRPTPGT